MARRFQLAWSVILAATLACSSSGITDTAEFDGNFAADVVDGSQLPTVQLLAPLTGDTLMLVAATLEVLSRGRVRLVRGWQWRPVNAEAGLVVEDTLVRTYSEQDGVVLIEHPAFGGAPAFTDTVQFLARTLLARSLIAPPPHMSRTGAWRNVLYVRASG